METVDYVNTANISAILTQYKIIPQIINSERDNLDFLLIHFDNHTVNLGNELTPTIVKEVPTFIKWPTFSSYNYYTLILIGAVCN